MSLSEKIKIRRIEYDLSQPELARRVGVSQAAIGYYEKGHKVPSVPTLIKIADALNVSLDWLVGREPHLIREEDLNK